MSAFLDLYWHLFRYVSSIHSRRYQNTALPLIEVFSYLFLQRFIHPHPEDDVSESYENLIDGMKTRVAEGKLKVVIVHGTEDTVVPISNSRRLLAAIPGAHLIEIPRCGHVPHEEEKEAFLQHLSSIL